MSLCRSPCGCGAAQRLVRRGWAVADTEKSGLVWRACTVRCTGGSARSVSMPDARATVGEKARGMRRRASPFSASDNVSVGPAQQTRSPSGGLQGNRAIYTSRRTRGDWTRLHRSPQRKAPAIVNGRGVAQQLPSCSRTSSHLLKAVTRSVLPPRTDEEFRRDSPAAWPRRAALDHPIRHPAPLP